MIRRLLSSALLILAATLVTGGAAHAEQNFLMLRVYDNFDSTMEHAQKAIEEHGYTVSHIQRCDGGLSKVGYKTDKYRVLFFGKPDEVRQISNEHPEMIPFLPLKMLVYAEDDQSLVTVMNPEELSDFVTSKKLRTQLRRWKADFESMLADINRRSKEK